MSIIELKKANCKNCYKCIRECSVKCIEFKHGQVKILEDECLLCGHCFKVCPQNAKQVRSDIQKVKDLLTSGDVVCSIAPSFISSFETNGMAGLTAALKKLGFKHAEETARGAYVVSRQYEQMAAAHNKPNIITSACPSVTALIEQYYPELIGMVADCLSPMEAHARILKHEHPNCSVVFIGPCISKKKEAERKDNCPYIDAVITFEELQEWFDSTSICLERENDTNTSYNASVLFPKSGGIIQSMDTQLLDYHFVSVDGIKKCKEICENILSGDIQGYFIEMSSCEGGCINGPCIPDNKGGILTGFGKVEQYAKNHSFDEPEKQDTAYLDMSKEFKPNINHKDIPGEAKIKEILARIGKYTKEQELNCGACGYASCRDKAIAVYQGKAQIEMCLPYMFERAENISEVIINSTPNAIIAVDDQLVVQHVNKSAERLFGWIGPRLRGTLLKDILDPADFAYVVATRKNQVNQKAYYKSYGKHVEQSIIYAKEHKLIYGILKDITREQEQQEQLQKVKEDTVDIAGKVIEKQMRVAQEIASILGETTAETKIALTKLKETIIREGECR